MISYRHAHPSPTVKIPQRNSAGIIDMMQSIITKCDLAIELYDDSKTTAPRRKVQVSTAT
jgi:hypothetical protein